MNANFRRDKIPVWINILSGIVILILLFITYSALVNPALAYGLVDGTIEATKKVLWELAGRNIAMLVITILALHSQNAMLLAITMIINIVRESFDMYLGIHFSNGDTKQILEAFFFPIFLILYFIALGKLKHIVKV